ncbi:MAG: pyridoxine 5'-phosphate synthase [Desulfobulbus propionicus]|nr:MAG: pyridoxine 5'-phosphate synthase [Desulfobulbus propionicus]
MPALLSCTPYRRRVSNELLLHFADRLLLLLGQAGRNVSIVLLDDETMADYNQHFRGRAGATNVLSFPAANPPGFPAPPEEDLGDILLSVDTASREASRLGVGLNYRLTELLIHGLLHLLDYDHERSEEDAKKMYAMERQLFAQFTREKEHIMPHLAINVDHVATVRQARGTVEPDPVHAAAVCELAGAMGIVAHLREDRRHMQDRDIRLLRETVKTKLNLEMAPTQEMIAIAAQIQPDLVTLVPEKRQELTTEGGLDVRGNAKKINKAVAQLTDAGIPVSLFIDPDAEQIEASLEAGATFVELHTGRYSDAADAEETEEEFQLIRQSAMLAKDSGLRVNAGHGLDYRNTARIAALPAIDELSIGHAVISRAVLVGLDQAVREMLALIQAQPAAW